MNGKRQVGFTGSIVEEVDGAKYNELWEGHRPANAHTRRQRLVGYSQNQSPK